MEEKAFRDKAHKFILISEEECGDDLIWRVYSVRESYHQFNEMFIADSLAEAIDRLAGYEEWRWHIAHHAHNQMMNELCDQWNADQ
jgi:hypothetical protein